MTAVAIETSVLESLDFEIVCQATYVWTFLRHADGEFDHCEAAATHTAAIHSVIDCRWIEKFLCAAHAKSYRDNCPACSTTPRIKNCQHIGKPS